MTLTSRPGDRDSPPADSAASGDPSPAPDGRLAGLRRSPLVRRVTGYSAGSVIAAFTSELAFAASFGWLHSGTTWASAAGFVGGAIPNYILNRRWAWSDRRGRTRRNEVILYMAVSLASFLVSAVVTDRAERWARHLTASQDMRVVLVAAAYLAVSAVFFAGKFVVYELIVFTHGPAPSEPASSESRSAGPHPAGLKPGSVPPSAFPAGAFDDAGPAGPARTASDADQAPTG